MFRQDVKHTVCTTIYESDVEQYKEKEYDVKHLDKFRLKRGKRLTGQAFLQRVKCLKKDKAV